MKRCLFVATLFLVGCSIVERPEPLPPDEVLSKSAQESQSLGSATFTSTVVFDIKQSLFNVNGTASIDGRLQNAGQDVLASIELHAGGKLSDGDFSVGATIESIIMGEDALYFKINTFTLEPEDAMFAAGTVATLQGKWWQLPLRGSGQGSVPITPDPQLLRAQVEVVDVMEDHGFKKIDGHNAYHYTVSINRDRLLKFLEKRAEEEEGSFDRDEAIVMLERLTVTGELWIDAETYHVRKVEWEAKQAATKEDEQESTLSFTMSLNDHNEAEPITAPADAEPFSPFAFVGMPGGALPTQDMILQEMEGMPIPTKLNNMDAAEQEALLRQLLEDGSIPFPTQ